jgi:glycolate oxidase FAD binding subunit
MRTVEPTSTAAVADALRQASAVLARGGGTKLTWGRPPERVDTVVDLRGLDRIVDHAAGDLVVVAQAGVPLADLQRHVARSGQRLAIDGAPTGATLGGIIATAASGPLRHRYGTVRDLLIGCTFVRADGTVARSGGRVVKNVAGYDLGKLLTGSYGTLGVVTEAVFRLHPLPAAAATVTAAVPDAATAARLVVAVTRAQVVPSAVELDWPAGGPGTLAVLLEGIPAGVAGRAAATARLVGGEVTGPPSWWDRRVWTVGQLALKLTFLRTGLAAILAHAADNAIALRGSPGVGVLYGATTDPSTVEPLRARCQRHGGSLVVLDAPPEVKANLDIWGPIPALDLMRRVKEQFDPERVLAPGRFVGGI